MAEPSEDVKAGAGLPGGTARSRGLRARIASVSVRTRLLSIALVGVVLSLGVAGAALSGFRQIGASTNDDGLNAARTKIQDGDMIHDELRAVAYAAALHGRMGEALGGAEREAARAERRWLNDLEAIDLRELPGPVAARIADVRQGIGPFVRSVDDVTQFARTDPARAQLALQAVEARFARLEVQQARLTASLTRAADFARAQEDDARRAATTRVLIGTALAVVLLVGLSFLLGRSIVRSLRRVSRTARRIVAGDLDARTVVTSSDEIGSLAQSVNDMADSLTGFVSRIESEADRHAFGRRLGEAFEMADDEASAHAVVRRAMAEIEADAPMELLLADSSRAHLESVASSPTGGAPGCGVQSPYDCVAVRRGSPAIFEESGALNACPHLLGRGCSATCVPLSFMGRALGVLHVTGPEGEPADAPVTAQLAELAEQAGNRIGTVRAFAQTQLQASTDSLTGLANRRNFENRARDVLAAGGTAAVAIADLDWFKNLNDTHGHAAGDRALSHFAAVLRDGLRSDDVIGRIGGEEFGVLLPGLGAAEAAAAFGRVRAALDASLAGGSTPAFTVSIGIADTADGERLEDLLSVADDRLYAAKAAGRDTVVSAAQNGGPPRERAADVSARRAAKDHVQAALRTDG